MDQLNDSQGFISKARNNQRMPWLRLHITNLCNFNCPGCHVFKISENKVLATNMPFEVAEKGLINFAKLIKNIFPKRGIFI
jgi:molybdenum cofactor biosynthesis enzyme MoaA